MARFAVEVKRRGHFRVRANPVQLKFHGMLRPNGFRHDEKRQYLNHSYLGNVQHLPYMLCTAKKMVGNANDIRYGYPCSCSPGNFNQTRLSSEPPSLSAPLSIEGMWLRTVVVPDICKLVSQVPRRIVTGVRMRISYIGLGVPVKVFHATAAAAAATATRTIICSPV